MHINNKETSSKHYHFFELPRVLTRTEDLRKGEKSLSMNMASVIAEGTYLIENVETQRYLFQDGPEIKGNRGDEGGWTEAPSVVGADANYYNRAYWKIIPQGNDKYFIENVETKRYLFSTGAKIEGDRGSEGGWTNAPKIVGADANYYNRAYWKIIPQGDDKYFFENFETLRYVFQDGPKIEGNRGDEGGWTSAPKTLGSDANYYNRAYWKLLKQ